MCELHKISANHSVASDNCPIRVSRIEHLKIFHRKQANGQEIAENEQMILN